MLKWICFNFIFILFAICIFCNSTVDNNGSEQKVETRRVVNRDHFMSLEDDSILVYAFTDELDFLQNSASHEEKMEAIATLTEGQQHLLMSIVVLLAHRHGSWDYFMNSYSFGHEDKDAFWKRVKAGLTYLNDNEMLDIFSRVIDLYHSNNTENKTDAYKLLDEEFNNRISLSIKNAANFIKENYKEYVIFEDECLI